MKKLMTITEFIEQYHVSRSTVYRLFDKGELTAVKIGRATRINVDEVNAWLNRLMSCQTERAVDGPM